jgi:hypothetical protein
MKPCFCCKETKELSLFFKHSQTPDGLHSWCKECCKKGNQKSKIKVNSTIESRAKVFLQNAKKSAKKRNQEFSLEIPDVVDCWNDQLMICAYSGIEMTLEARKLNTVSIERINRMKSDFSYQDFYMLCRCLVSFCFLFNT